MFARNPRATWVCMFADGLNPHSRCVFGGVNMVIDRDKSLADPVVGGGRTWHAPVTAADL